MATLWRDKLPGTFHSVTYPATTKIVARQVARKEGLNSTFGNGSCNLFRNDFGRCKVCYTEKCFVQLDPPQCRQNIARQVARKEGLNSTFGNGSCNLFRNDFGRCKVCYTEKCFVQLDPPQCRQNIARQVARNILQCNSALRTVPTNLKVFLPRFMTMEET